jgi:hypothetical protein
VYGAKQQINTASHPATQSKVRTPTAVFVDKLLQFDANLIEGVSEFTV